MTYSFHKSNYLGKFVKSGEFCYFKFLFLDLGPVFMCCHDNRGKPYFPTKPVRIIYNKVLKKRSSKVPTKCFVRP